MRFYSLLIVLLIAAVLPCSPGRAQEPAINEAWPPEQPPEETDPTSQRLIELNLKVRGGEKAVRSAKSLRFTGECVEHFSEFDYTVLIARPRAIRIDKFRFHLGYDHLTVKASNGSLKWSQVIQPDKKLPQPMDGLEAALLDLEARIPFLFLNHKEQGHRFVYRGKTRYLGKPAYLVHGWLASGLRVDILFDTESFQIVNYRHPYRIGGKNVIVDRTPTALSKVEGVWWEFGYRIHIRGKDIRTVRFGEVEVNVPAPPERFSMPPTNERWLRG